MTTPESESRTLLSFTRRQWRAMCNELARRGGGRREAGAFLLGHRDDRLRRVQRVVFLDDLDPHCLTGGITFSGSAYSQLWDICDQFQLQVLGDVHTHPSSGVMQSDTDSSNPMVARAGHVALIVPRYAIGRIRARQVGVHLYRGEDWRSSFDRDARRRLRVGWWR